MPDTRVRELHRAKGDGVQHPTDEAMAEATAHLVTALTLLDRLAICPHEPAFGHRFIQLDVASHAIHSALINLEGWNEGDECHQNR